MERSRKYCFTINNWTSSDLYAVKNMFKSASYGIVGQEVGENGTHHLQGYVRFKNDKSFKVMKHMLVRAHLEPAKGSDVDNQKYCGKGENIYEVGEVEIGQGTRTDIKDLAKKIREKMLSIEDVMFEYPELYMKYSRAIEKMFNAVMEHRSEAPLVFWRWGLAGTGKTRGCMDLHSPEQVYVKDGTPWWDGYKQQEAIVIDDFDNAIPYRTLLRILDRYQYQGQVKGGYVNINSKYIYITCEHPPEYYWRGNELQQVTRRLTSVDEIK